MKGRCWRGVCRAKGQARLGRGPQAACPAPPPLLPSETETAQLDNLGHSMSTPAMSKPLALLHSSVSPCFHLPTDLRDSVEPLMPLRPLKRKNTHACVAPIAAFREQRLRGSNARLLNQYFSPETPCSAGPLARPLQSVAHFRRRRDGLAASKWHSTSVRRVAEGKAKVKAFTQWFRLNDLPCSVEFLPG